MLERKKINKVSYLMHRPQLIETQMLLEDEAVSYGVKQYQKQLLAGGLASASIGVKLLKSTIQAFIELYTCWYAQQDKSYGKSSTSIAFNLIKRDIVKTTPEQLGYILCHRCVNSLGHGDEPIQKLAVSVAERILINEELKKVDANLIDSIKEKLYTRSSYKKLEYVLKTKKNMLDAQQTKWTVIEKVKLGMKLLHLFQEATGLFDRFSYRRSMSKTSMRTRVKPSPKLKSWLNRMHSKAEVLQPMHLPMVIAPLAWTNLTGGGYLTIGEPLIRTKRHKVFRELMWRHNSQDLCDRVNRLQQVAFVLDKDIAELMRNTWEEGGGVGDMPPRFDPEIPEAPWEVQGYEPSEEEVSRFKHKKAIIWEDNRANESKRIAWESKLWIADKFSKFPALYYSWFADWRGRFYPHAAFLNPQADDSKALLRYKNKVELGSQGKWWLYLHTAGKYGIKGSNIDLYKWTLEHVEHFDKDLWRSADKPFQFYGAYKECMALKDWEVKHTAESFKSNLNCDVDGSCNGFQHLSALIYDRIGAEAVNLTYNKPNQPPKDLYDMVLKASKLMLQGQTGEVVDIALNLIYRNFIKQNVMTTPYGVSNFGMRKQLLHYVKRKTQWLIDGSIQPKDLTEFITIVTKAVIHGIDRTIPASRIVMDWLTECCEVLVSHGITPEWVTPSGFNVIHDYPFLNVKAINTYWGKLKIKNRVGEFDDKKIDEHKQKKGIAPNFIHSLDASHLAMTMDLCSFDDFVFVHDSYGCHVGNMQELQINIRKAFHKLYSKDKNGFGILDNIRAQWTYQLSTCPDIHDIMDADYELPEVPDYGTYNPEEVLSSPYFFGA